MNDPDGADLMILRGGASKVIKKVMPTERFEITGDNTTFWYVKFEDGTTGEIEKIKVVKYE